ncbi:hypothetical protein R69746_06009 [Paraburkholderia aspalathi]|nr:hypothetical protein R69746_06009 [Paraburkholderia aspalathi]
MQTQFILHMCRHLCVGVYPESGQRPPKAGDRDWRLVVVRGTLSWPGKSAPHYASLNRRSGRSTKKAKDRYSEGSDNSIYLGREAFASIRSRKRCHG